MICLLLMPEVPELRQQSCASRVAPAELRLCSALPFSLRSRGLIYGQVTVIFSQEANFQNYPFRIFCVFGFHNYINLCDLSVNTYF